MSKHTKEGIFITFEGGEGAGKSTHIAFLAYCLRQLGYEVVCLREPGGTAVGEMLRTIVLDPKNENLDARAELFIYEAARAQIVSELISPALGRGAVVLCDRFYDSTLAYQAAGRGLSARFIEEANAFACNGVVPHRTILMVSATAEEGLVRATDEGADRIERAGLDFHTRVNAAFLDIARQQPKRVRVVEFAESKEQTARQVFENVYDVIPELHQAVQADAHFFDRIENKALYKEVNADKKAEASQDAQACKDAPVSKDVEESAC